MIPIVAQSLAAQTPVSAGRPKLVFDSDGIPKKPVPARLVNDFAGKLSPEESARLERKLRQFSKERTHQIVLVILPSLDGNEIADFSQRLAESWGIGQKGKDNGLLILTALKERKVRIEVGYGLEPVVPDLVAKRIIDGILVPRFKKGRFYEAYDSATDFLIERLTKHLSGDPLEAGGADSVQDEDQKAAAETEGGWSRIWLYVLWVLSILGIIGHHSESKGLHRFFGFTLAFLILASLAFGEILYLFFSTDAFLWSLGAVPLGLILLFWPVLRFLGKRSRNFARLLEYTQSDQKWHSLFSEYRKPEVLGKWEHFRKIVEQEKLTPDKTKRVEEINAEIEKIFKEPQKYFKKKSNLELLNLQSEIHQSKILGALEYNEEKRKHYRSFLKDRTAYFYKRADSDLSPEDASKYKETLIVLSKLLSDPESVLGVDTERLKSRIESFVQNESQWKKYKKDYTEESIDRTKKTFQEKYEALKQTSNPEARTQKALDFYKNYVKTIQESPSSFLVKKPIIEESPSSSSSSTSSGWSISSSDSWSDSSSSSWSSDSSDSFDFGGGSFGGGGASGDW